MKVSIKASSDGSIKRIVTINDQLVISAKRALISVAQLAQTAVIQQIKTDFTIRTGWYQPSNPYGIHVRFTRDKFDLNVTLETAADWLDDHETGATRTADQAGHHGPDPHLTFPELGGARQSLQDIVLQRNKAWRILPNVSLLGGGSRRTSGRPSTSKGKRQPKFKTVPFFINKTGTAIYERLPGHHLKLFYTLPKAVSIKKDSTVTEPTIDVVLSEFGVEFNKALADSLQKKTP